MLSALMVSAVGHASEHFLEHDAHIRGCAFVNARRQTSSQPACINRTDTILKLLVREFLATARAGHWAVCFLSSATSWAVICDGLLPKREVT
jgi:hypothetical protein